MSSLLSMDGTRAIGFLFPLQECNGLDDHKEGVDVVGAKGINIVFSFTCCNNFKLVDLDLDFLLPHKYALVHH